MIFVTVGTHEQQFNRLVEEIDCLVERNKIDEKVFVQLGYCSYIPKHCDYKRIIGYREMNELAQKSSIIITHGGPGSIFLAHQYNKIPIVVPRRVEFQEHVDNHQVKFVEKISKSSESNIYYVNNIDDLYFKIEEARANLSFQRNVNKKNKFTEKFECIVMEVLN